MTRRNSVYLALIALLVAVNLARWLMPSGKGAEASAAHSKVFLPEDFRLRMDFPAASASRRNLFQPNGVASPMAKTHTGRMRLKAVAQPPVQHEQNETKAADSVLGNLKLLCVVFRGGKGQAYLALGKI